MLLEPSVDQNSLAGWCKTVKTEQIEKQVSARTEGKCDAVYPIGFFFFFFFLKKYIYIYIYIYIKYFLYFKRFFFSTSILKYQKYILKK